MMAQHLPKLVRIASRLASDAGFAMSCHPDTGRFLATLAATVPINGRVLEICTGTGVGTAWIVHGLHNRNDVEVLTIEIDPVTAERAAAIPWPTWVEILVGDAVEVTPQSGSFDLIFADAEGGKWEGLDSTLKAIRPGGLLLVDDMTPDTFANERHKHKTHEVRDRLLNEPQLLSVEIGWSTGLILSTRPRL